MVYSKKKEDVTFDGKEWSTELKMDESPWRGDIHNNLVQHQP